MAIKLKVRKVGNSLGVVLPKEALAELKVEEGQSLYLTSTPDGYKVSAGQSDFDRKMAIVESLCDRYRNTLRELSK